jgi:predicted RND superfamily exporter protein
MRFDPFQGSAIKPNLLQSIQLFIVNHPWVCILFTLFLVACSGYGLKFAEFNNDSRALFADDNEGMKRLTALEDKFSKDDNVIIIVRPQNGDVFTQRNLKLLQQLTEKAWTIPKTQRVDSLTNFQHTQVDGDELNVVDLVGDVDQLSDSDLAKIKHIALNEPNLVKNVVSVSGHAASVSVTVITEDRKGQEAPMIMDYVEQMRDEFSRDYPDVEIMLTGMVAFKSASRSTTENELSSTSIYSGIAILLCLLIMLRSIVSVIQTMLVIILSIVVAMGSIVWLGVEITPVMGGAPAIILTLAVADSIHLLITYQHQIRQGADKYQATYETLRINTQPVFLTSLTTAIGFLFLNSSESPPFADMANMVSIGVMAAWFLSVVFLPALLVVLPQQRFMGGNRDHRIMDGFADFVVDHRKPVFIVSSVVFATLALFSLKNEFNDVWMEYFDETYEVRRATEFMVKELTGNHRLQFAFPSGETSGIMEPEYMRGLESFANWARQQPEVEYVSSFSDTIKRLNRDMNGGNPDFYRIPDQRDLISQYSLMFQMSLPFGLGLENQIDMDQSTVRVNVLLGGVSSNEILAFESRADQWIQQNLPPSMEVRGVGFDLLLGELSYQNGQGMLVGTVLALLVVSMLLVVALRSVKYGLLSMLPNLFPAVISFGIWAMIDGQIGISVSIVACMTLGIVIDNTVHFLSKYTRAKQESNLTSIEATRYAFKTVGIALVATTLVISANFGMMSFSHYYPNASMGLLTAITVAVALAVNFLFFVPVLLFVDHRNNDNKTTQDSHCNGTVYEVNSVS